MFKAITGIFSLWSVCLAQHFGDEAIYTINGKKALQSVSEKFLSISIDPAVILTGLNLSETSLQLAKHLSPAYVRIVGPSTQFVQYRDENSNEYWPENGNVVVTPTMWFGINEWLASAKLTPVFGINDGETADGEWNPQSAMPLLDISDKFNITCYWQLGYDCANKSEEQYKKDLRRLHHVLESFPDKRDIWRIVGSDLSRCVPDGTKRVLQDLSNILTAVVWEQKTNISQSLKSKIPMWTVSPKPTHPTSFSSAISWAKDIGESAKEGYEVIFRQLRLHEMFAETPPFWVSVLHKMLMGRHVLEVKSAHTKAGGQHLTVYAQCTKHQNSFTRSGAMTVFMVNNGTGSHTALLRFGTVSLKNTEVQSYILTAKSEEATEVYLNGEKLSMVNLTQGKLDVLPELRRAKIVNYLSLSLPSKSVGFFVIPTARIPVCINEETELKLLMEEIGEDQKVKFPEEASKKLAPRFSISRSPTLKELQRDMEKELESDERYYRKMHQKKRQQMPENRNHNHKRKEVVQLYKGKPRKAEEPKRIFELELTSAEIQKVLIGRAKVRAAKKNIIFTGKELDEIIRKATEKILKNNNAMIRIRKKTKREVASGKKDVNLRLAKLKSFGNKRKLLRQTPPRRIRKEKRVRRDINMDLLKLKTELSQNKNKKLSKSKFGDDQDQEATIRESGQTSDELFKDREEDNPLPKKDLFAEIEDEDELLFTTTEKSNRFHLAPKKRPSLYNFHSSGLPKFNEQPKSIKISFDEHFPKEQPKPTQVNLDEDFPVDSEPEEPSDYYDCIHEYFGTNVGETNDNRNIAELWEVAYKSQESDKSFQAINNRGGEVGSVKLDQRFKEDELNLFLDNDYDDFESDETNPVRLKRSEVKHKKHQKKVEFSNGNKMLLRRSRAISERDNSFNKRYKPLTKGLRRWKASDMVTLNKLKKSKRSVDNYLSSMENEIDNFMNEIEKQRNVTHRQSGDYQLVFPNEDKVEFVETLGTTEVKWMVHDNPTCPITRAAITTTSTISSTNIQKIPKEYGGNVWQKLVRQISIFFQGLSKKMTKYIMEELLQ